jgi:4-amino-4-deoxy-L-arabinose transferase-like glycosyltransferase
MNKRFWLLPLFVLAILLVGSYLRLYRIDEYLTFLGDEGRDVIRVRQMLVEGDLIFLGPTASVGGFFLGPLYYYLMAPFLWLWRYDPVGPAVMVALFGIATIYLVYYFGKKVFHTSVGLTAALLYALSPLTIAYSRSSWKPQCRPFFLAAAHDTPLESCSD